MIKNTKRDVLVVGLMLFATYFGAGNLIFPPYIGTYTGSSWVLPSIGFLLTGVGIPMLGVIALSAAGGRPDDFSRRSWPILSKILNVIIIIMIGPLFGIPRTAATTCEMSIMPFLNDSINPDLVHIVVSFVFFFLTFLLTQSSSKGLDKIGSVLAPILVVFLFITLVLSVAFPIGVPVARDIGKNPLYFGVINGYQTMDGIGSVTIGGAGAIYFLSIGYKREQVNKLLPKCALISGVLMAIVYIGFIWIGASGSAVLQTYLSQRTLLLSNAIHMLAGNFAKLLLAILIFFACLTTSGGLTISFTEYFYNLFNKKVNKRLICIVCIIASFSISLIGVEGIISLAGPILEGVYPIVIILILVNIFDKFIKHDIIIKGAVAGVISVVPLLVLRNIDYSKNFAESILNIIPLGKYGFAYISTCLVGVLIAIIILKLSKSAKTQ